MNPKTKNTNKTKCETNPPKGEDHENKALLQLVAWSIKKLLVDLGMTLEEVEEWMDRGFPFVALGITRAAALRELRCSIADMTLVEKVLTLWEKEEWR